MFPRYFPYGQPSSVPNINPLLSLSLGLPLDATSISPSQDLSSLLLSAQPNISAATTFQAASPYFLPQATQFLAGIPVTNSVNPLMAQFSLSQMLPLLNPALLQNQISEFSSTPSNTTDSHTIVRAPVFYGSSNGNADSQISTSKEVNKSPPDQIVETYAAAVHAAAIAHQQPLSNAAEVFLSTAASAASSLASSNGTGVTTAKNRASQKRVLSGVSSPIGNTVVKTSSAASSKPPLPWNSTWTRMVDRQADVVVYMSPGGSRLKSVADVRAHLERWLSAERASAITDECINSSFCFDATRESRFVSAPDDSVFVFPEDAVALNTNSTTTPPSSDNAPPPLPPSSSPTVQQPDSGIGDTSVTMSSASSSSETSVLTTAASVIAISMPADTVGSLKRSAPESESTDSRNGLEIPSAELSLKPEAPIENVGKEEDSTPAAKMMKLEPKGSSSLVQMPLPSRSSDTAQITPSFVARSMARAGGLTTVVPSAVPSVLPPSTTTSASNAYALVQHLASIQQQQALLASAGFIHPVVDAAAQQQQLLEHFKQQQAVAATALFLQQQNQHHLQLQQHLQAVYASAIQQQQQQQALQQQQQNSNNQNGGGQ